MGFRQGSPHLLSSTRTDFHPRRRLFTDDPLSPAAAQPYSVACAFSV